VGGVNSCTDFSSARRQDFGEEDSFLERVLAEPVREQRFQRATTVIKGLLLASLVTVLVVLGQLHGWGRLL
jgi:hypothetical protein